MKKSISVLAMTCTALSGVISTAALAVPTYDTPVANATTTAEMSTQCNNYLTYLNAAYAPREFTSVAIEYITYATVVGSLVSSVPIAGTTLPVGPQTGADASGAAANLANGKSPNIFTTDAKAVYAGGSTFKTNDTYATTQYFDWFCTPTEKIAGASTQRPETQGECASRIAAEDPHLNPGQYCSDLANRIQVTVPGEPTFVPDISLAKGFETTQAGTATDVGTGFNTSPYTDQSSHVQAVVCISPTKNPGTWRGVNGFSSAGCSYAKYIELNAAGTPSNSLPTT